MFHLRIVDFTLHLVMEYVNLDAKNQNTVNLKKNVLFHPTWGLGTFFSSNKSLSIKLKIINIMYRQVYLDKLDWLNLRTSEPLISSNYYSRSLVL